MHREAAAPHLRATAPDADFSPELDDVVRKAMSKRPADRFQSAAELAAALAATPEGKRSAHDIAGPAPAPPRKPAANKAKGAAEGAAPTRRRDDGRLLVGGAPSHGRGGDGVEGGAPVAAGGDRPAVSGGRDARRC